MSQPPPPPPNLPPPGGFGPPEQPPYGAGEPTVGDGIAIPGTPPPPPGTPPMAPPVVPGGQPGQPGYGYPQAPPPQAPPGQPPAPSPYQSPYAAGPAATEGAGFGAPTSGTGFGAPTSGAGFGTPTAPGPYGPATGGAGFGAVPPTPPGTGRKRPNSRLLLAIAGVFALLLAGGGAVVLFTGDDGSSTAGDANGDGDGGGGEDGGGEAEGAEGGTGGGEGGGLPTEPIQASLAWEVPSPEVTEEAGIIDARGTWLLDDAFVRVVPEGLVSYDLETGEENWSLPFELSEGSCLPSQNVSENRIALLQGRDCEALTVVDIAAGEEIMTMPLDSEWPTDTNSSPAILGDTVAVGTGVGSMGFSISQQEKLWEASSTDNCKEVAYAVVDDMFISQMGCGWLAEEGGSIRATNEAGDELWKWDFEGTFEDQPLTVDSVISVEPLVVTATVGEDALAAGAKRIFVIDESHQEIAVQIEYDADRYMNPCEVNTFLNCWLGQVHDGFLYLPTSVPYGDNAVVAFDLSTGQPLYEVPAINGGQIWPFDVQDGKILAYQAASDTLEGMVVAIDPATEEATPVMALDRQAREKEYALMAGIFTHDQIALWHNNTLVLSNRSFYSSDGPEVPSVLTYR
ncbi:outer membrane protein assembly factor BamB family protein [Streptomyces litchfieldiae]|uniref:PQQ-binding-like beta-propeller repeat protein n=1 Tax=Streptomyces litchfieldiae TaxID=3075543 RepID=A0ABU2N2N0_9ACTN|nr:PQQ-binding-like beta-propeller repeat protein [Streptomyces sp. DSM 44938]MDT0346989.1 PQQ-binding-like beta-propeller repeat protein [Streptomyces sp. DSM 44938]